MDSDLTRSDDLAIVTTNTIVTPRLNPELSLTGQRTFRLQAKKLFLTYPQCQTTKEEVLENSTVLEKSISSVMEWIVIAEEKHKDGTPHLHVGICFKEKVQFKGKKGHQTLRQLVKGIAHPEGKAGNFCAMRSFQGSMGYLVKEGNFLARGIDPLVVLGEKKKDSEFRTAIAKMVEGSSALDIMEAYPATYALRRRNILDFQFDLQMSKRFTSSSEKLLKITLRNEIDKNGSVDALVGWLNSNVVDGMATTRIFKQKQLWLWGPSNIGKSTLLNNLMKGLRTYHIPPKDFYCEWDDKAYDLAVLDEYTGCKTIGWLNQWLEGANLPLDQKNKPCYIKQFNIATIICSNLSPEQVYLKCPPVQHQALSNRLEVIYCTDLIELDYQWEEKMV